MRRIMLTLGVAVALLGACGDGDTEESVVDDAGSEVGETSEDEGAASEDGSGGGSAGAVVDPAPPGQAPIGTTRAGSAAST